jgi:hypothetical protein
VVSFSIKPTNGRAHPVLTPERDLDLTYVIAWADACAALLDAGRGAGARALLHHLTAETTAEAADGWAELVEFVEVLGVWNAAQAGDAGAAALLADALLEVAA